jgi:hypothetical protein
VIEIDRFHVPILPEVELAIEGEGVKGKLFSQTENLAALARFAGIRYISILLTLGPYGQGCFLAIAKRNPQ